MAEISKGDYVSVTLQGVVMSTGSDSINIKVDKDNDNNFHFVRPSSAEVKVIDPPEYQPKTGRYFVLMSKGGGRIRTGYRYIAGGFSLSMYGGIEDDLEEFKSWKELRQKYVPALWILTSDLAQQ